MLCYHIYCYNDHPFTCKSLCTFTLSSVRNKMEVELIDKKEGDL